LKPYEKALRRLRKLHMYPSRQEFRPKNRFEAKVKLIKATLSMRRSTNSCLLSEIRSISL
jgi:hypothetical protein